MASHIQMQSWIKTQEALLHAQQLLPSSHQRQGRRSRAVLESKFIVFETKSVFPCRRGGRIVSRWAQEPCKGIVTQLAPLCCYPGTCIPWLLFLPVKSAGFYPTLPWDPAHLSVILFFFFFSVMQGVTKTVSESSTCVYSSFPACLAQASQGMDGQEMACAASAGKMMVHLDRRNAETMFMAAVVMPNSGASPCPLGIKAPFCKASAFTNGLFWPGRVFCAGCPLTEISVFPAQQMLMHMVCVSNRGHFQCGKQSGQERDVSQLQSSYQYYVAIIMF